MVYTNLIESTHASIASQVSAICEDQQPLFKLKRLLKSCAEYQLRANSLCIRPIYLQRSLNKNTLNSQHTRYLGPEIVSMRKPPPGGRLRSEQGAMNTMSSISNLNREGLEAGASWVSLYEWERFE